MEEKKSRDGTETEDSGAYELDLSEDAESQVDDLMRDALAAVEAVEEKKLKKNVEEDSSLDIEIDTDDSAASTAADVIQPEVLLESDETEKDPGVDPAEVEELRNRLMRTLADFDNFRKRAEKEKEAHKRFAVADALKDSLTVADNLERALASSGSVEELKQGVEMILRQQADVLKRWGVVPVRAVGEAFDPAVHEAVAREDSPDLDIPTVTGELQRGYMIHDRLLRPAMVTVAMPAPRPKAASEDKAASGDGDSDPSAN